MSCKGKPPLGAPSEFVGMCEHNRCPWWVGDFLASPIRRRLHDSARILSSYVRTGMTVLEPGPGMGFFTLEIARLVGPTGRVIAVDVEPRMNQGVETTCLEGLGYSIVLTLASSPR